MANLIINTTQNVTITLDVASLGKRILAFCLDLLFQISYVLLFFFISQNLFKNIVNSSSVSSFINGFLLFSPVIFYSLFFEIVLQGYTPGKKILRLRVLTNQGYSPRVSDYFIRWVFRLIDIWSFFGVLGISSIVISKHNQRLGDILSNCVVVDQLSFKKGLEQTIYKELEHSYKPVYLQALNFSDADMGIIIKAYQNYLSTKDAKVLRLLVDKIESTISIDRKEQQDEQFVNTVIKDYNYLSGKV